MLGLEHVLDSLNTHLIVLGGVGDVRWEFTLRVTCEHHLAVVTDHLKHPNDPGAKVNTDRRYVPSYP